MCVLIQASPVDIVSIALKVTAVLGLPLSEFCVHVLQTYGRIPQTMDRVVAKSLPA